MTIKAVLVNDTSVQNHYGCKIVVKNIKACALRAGLEIITSVPVNKSWRDDVCLSALDECDVVIVNGEGTLHSSKKSAVELSEIGPYCLTLSKPCFLINSVYQNNSTAIAKNLKTFTAVYVRESYSQKELESQGIASQIVPDMIFYNNPFLGSDFEISREKFLFSGSVYKDVSNALYAASKKFEDARFVTLWEKPVIKDVKSSKKSTKRKIIDQAKELFPFNHRVKINRFFGVMDEDYDFDVNHHSTESFEDLIGIIMGAEYLYTGYFHFICLAIMAKKPFSYVPSNTHKIEGLLHDIGLPARLLKVEDFRASSFNVLSQCDINNIETYLSFMPSKADDMMRLIYNSGA